jgi:hypothetical protein
MNTMTSILRWRDRRSAMAATPQYSRDTFGKRMKSIQEFAAH